MQEKGIQPPTPQLLQDIAERFRYGSEMAQYLSLIAAKYPKVQTFAVTFDPASVPANSEDVQTVTVGGLTTKDIVTVNKPSNTAGLDMVHAWVSAADTLSIKFRNHTGSPINAGSEDYLVSAIRR